MVPRAQLLFIKYSCAVIQHLFFENSKLNMDFISKSIGKMAINIDFVDIRGLNFQLRDTQAKKSQFAFKMSFFENGSF